MMRLLMAVTWNGSISSMHLRARGWPFLQLTASRKDPAVADTTSSMHTQLPHAPPTHPPTTFCRLACSVQHHGIGSTHMQSHKASSHFTHHMLRQLASFMPGTTSRFRMRPCAEP